MVGRTRLEAARVRIQKSGHNEFMANQVSRESSELDISLELR